MTLIIAMPCRDGVVLAADGQETRGDVRLPTRKIRRWGDSCIWAGAGSVALIQRVEEQLASIPLVPLTDMRDHIAQLITNSVRQLLQLDFRTPFFQNDPRALQSLCPGDFVFVQAHPEPKILRVSSVGTPEWIMDKVFASGSGDLFAYALLGKYWNNESFRGRVTTAEGSILAYKVIEEAIEVGAYGLGPPIDIWVIKDGDILCLNNTGGLAAISDTVRSIRETEIELLLKSPRSGDLEDEDFDIDLDITGEDHYDNPFT